MKFPPHQLVTDISAPDFPWAAMQLAFFAVGGCVILGVSFNEAWRRLSIDTLVLVLWAGGTFVFASYLNWTTSARNILPMAPPIIILVVRAIDAKIGPPGRLLERRLILPLLPAAVITFGLASADAWLANSARSAAYVIRQKTKNDLGTLWFEGHWGFQFYMQSLGAVPLDMRGSTLYAGDHLVVPQNSANVARLERGVSERVILQTTPKTLLPTTDRTVGAGFYSSVWGPLPFAFTRCRPEKYELLTLGQKMKFMPPLSTENTPNRSP